MSVWATQRLDERPRVAEEVELDPSAGQAEDHLQHDTSHGQR